MLEQLRQRLRALEKPSLLEGDAGLLPFGLAADRHDLGGGLARGALHEIAAAGEAHLAAATGFVLGLAAQKRTRVCWIAEDMALAESGALYGGGLDLFGLAPERLLDRRRGAPRAICLWAMEEALRCRAVGAVIGELRHGAIDAVAVRRLSLAAAAERRAGAAAARRARGRCLHRRHALDRWRGAVGGDDARAGRAPLCRAAHAQPPRPARLMDSAME